MLVPNQNIESEEKSDHEEEDEVVDPEVDMEIIGRHKSIHEVTHILYYLLPTTYVQHYVLVM